MSSTSAAAEWLQNSVGVGGVFTKEQLRAAFPGVTQIDRRVRDLRERGWVIDTRRQDPTLGQSEMRLVHIGGLTKPSNPINSKDRRDALVNWAYSCSLCGAQGSSIYSDAKHVRVQLVVTRVPGRPDLLVPVCLRCKPSVLKLEDGLSPVDEAVRQAASLDADQWRLACLARVARHLAEPH